LKVFGSKRYTVTGIDSLMPFRGRNAGGVEELELSELQLTPIESFYLAGASMCSG